MLEPMVPMAMLDTPMPLVPITLERGRLSPRLMPPFSMVPMLATPMPMALMAMPDTLTPMVPTTLARGLLMLSPRLMLSSMVPTAMLDTPMLPPMVPTPMPMVPMVPMATLDKKSPLALSQLFSITI